MKTPEDPRIAAVTRPEMVKPWLDLHEPRDPIIRFRADNRTWYGVPVHDLKPTYNEVANLIEVKARPYGTLLITGPKAENLFELLCAHAVTAIRSDQVGILTVELMPDQSGQEEADAAADGIELHPDEDSTASL
jgi:hypothetical protein